MLQRNRSERSWDVRRKYLGFSTKKFIFEYLSSGLMRYSQVIHPSFTSEFEQAGSINNPLLTSQLDYRLVEYASVPLMSETFNTLLHGKIYTDLIPVMDSFHGETRIKQTLRRSIFQYANQRSIIEFGSKGLCCLG